jgi:hypothetical protein
MQADQKGLKQAKYVIDYLNSWKGLGQHTMSYVQAAITSTVALSSLGDDTKIVDSDPCNVAVLGPTLVSIVPLESKQDTKNALPKLKTWGELKVFFETGAKRGIGEFVATTKRCFDPNNDPVLKAAPVAVVLRELGKTLKKMGLPEGKLAKVTKEGKTMLERFAKHSYTTL